MALSAFEALQEMKKKANTSVPAGSNPVAPTPSTTGRKSAFEALQELKKKPAVPAKGATPAAPAATAPKPDTSILMAPKSSADVLTPAPLSNQSVAASDAMPDLLIEKGRVAGNVVHDKVKEIRKNAKNTDVRTGAAIADTAIETAKDLFYRKPKALGQAQSLPGVAATGLDLGLNLATLGLLDFVTGAAPAVIGGAVEKTVGKVPKLKESGIAGKAGAKVEQGVQIGMDTIFNKILFEGVGGKAADVYSGVTGTDLTESERNAVKSIMTLGTVIVGFKGAQASGEYRGKRIESARTASGLVLPVGDSIGLKIDTDAQGRPIAPSDAAIANAHKAALDKAAAEGGPYMRAKMDAADTARQMLTDYKRLGPAAFDSEWRVAFEKGTEIAKKVEEQAFVANEEAKVVKKAETVREILDAPATNKTRKMADELSGEAQFAFEQELVDMAADNDPKLQKAAEGDGYSYERVSAPDDPRPAFFDALTNKITLNEVAIRKTLDRVWGGEVLKVGEGRTTTVFRKLADESFEKMKNRYEATLVDHELSHAKTIKPEDVARLRAAVGNDVEIEKIRKELEDRANEFSFQRANDLDAKTNADIDAAVSRIQEGLRVRDTLKELKFKDAAQEKAYADWRKEARKGKAPEASPEFRKRYEAERKTLDEYKVAREAQKKLESEVKRNPEVSRALKAEMRAERKATKLEGGKRKMDLKLLKERIARRLEQGVLKEKAAKVQDQMRAKFNNKTVAQQILTDYMREERVPMEVRGKFVSDLKNAKTPEQAMKIVDDIQAEYNKYSRQEKVTKITTLLKKSKLKRDASGKNVGKFTAEVQRKLDFVRNIAKESRNNLNQQIIGLVDEARAKMAESGEAGLALPEDIASKIELLELGGLKDQSLTQLKRTEATLQQLIETGKTERQDMVKRRADKIKRLISSGSTELIGTPERPMATQRAMAKGQNDPWHKRFYNSSALFEDLTREMGSVFDTAGKEAAAAVNRAVDIFSQEAGQMRERLSTSYGKNWRADMADLANVQTDFGMMKNAAGKNIEVRATRGSAMHVYMLLKEADGKEFVTSPDGLGLTPEIIDKMLSVMKPEDIKTADWIQQQGYVKQWKYLKPAYEARTGAPLGNVDNFAGTRKHVNGQTMGGETAIGLIEDMMDAAQSKRLSTNPNFVKSRVAQIGQLRLSDNPIADYLVYSKRAAHYVEVGEFAQEWKSLLADDGIRLSIQEKYGKSFLEALQYQVDNITRGGIDMAGRDSGATKLMDQVAGNVSAALLTSPRVWAGQLSSIFGMKAEMSTLPGTQADFWRGVKNAKANKADVLKYSPAVRTRLSATPSELMSQFTGDKGKIARALDRIKEWQAVPLEKMDSFTTLRGASGIFEAQKTHYLKQGFDIEKASRLAGADVDSVITRTQSTRQYIGKSQIETGAFRYFVQLKQQPTKIFRGNIEAAKMLSKGKITTKQYAAFFIWNNVIQGAAYTAMRSVPAYFLGQAALLGYKVIGDDEAYDKKNEEIKKDFSAKGLATDAAFNGLSNVTNAPIAGDVINTAINNIFRGRNYEFRPSVTQAIVDDIIDVGLQMSEGDYDESITTGIRAVSRVAGIGDPIDAFKWLLKVQSAANKERKADERKTPEGRKAAAEKAKKAAQEKRDKEVRIRARQR